MEGICRPQDIAHAAAFLASDKARYVTGEKGLVRRIREDPPRRQTRADLRIGRQRHDTRPILRRQYLQPDSRLSRRVNRRRRAGHHYAAQVRRRLNDVSVSACDDDIRLATKLFTTFSRPAGLFGHRLRSPHELSSAYQ